MDAAAEGRLPEAADPCLAPGAVPAPGPSPSPGPSALVSRAGAAARWATRSWRGYVYAGGAGPSGLANLVEMHAVSSAADAFVAVGLAGTLFFGVPVDQARPRVALYLLVTMAPFAVVAPLLGPLLDHFGHGRRVALATSLFGRAVLAMLLAGAIAGSNPVALYPEAFAILVLSRAYGVAKSAVVPRVLPAPVTLVRANSRLTLVSLLAGAFAAPLGIGIVTLTSTPWALRAAVAVYILAGLLAVRLPPRVDSRAGERELDLAVGGLIRHARRPLPRSVGQVLFPVVSLRALNGFLVLFVAFLVRTHPVGGHGSTVTIALLAVAATLGGVLGTITGARVSRVTPATVALAGLTVVAVLCGLTAALFTTVTVVALAFVATALTSFAKLGLDATIQREVAEDLRTSAFGRSETGLQLGWVTGGGIGVLLTLVLRGPFGLALAAAALAAAVLATLRLRFAGRRSPITSETMDSAGPR